MTVPQRVDEMIRQRLAQDALPPGSIKKKGKDLIDHYRFVVHVMEDRRSTDHRLRDEMKHIYISHRYLHRFISKDHTSTILTKLKEWEILEPDGRYWNGAKPKALGYRLTEPYRNDVLVSIPYTDHDLRSKVIARYDPDAAIAEEFFPPGYAECKRWHEHVEIDRDAAQSYISRAYEGRQADYRFRHAAINRIATKRFWFKKGKRSGRAFNNLSNLPKDLRDFLSVHGKRLGQVDIGCSQPLFLFLLLQKAGAIPTDEGNDMRALVTTNTLYEALDPGGVGRDQTKTRIYKEVLFRKKKRSTSVSKRFTERFPSYSNEIDRMHLEAEAGKGPSVAALLQSTEAEVVYAAVHRFAMRTDNSAPIMTIHDSLVTTTDHLPLAMQVLEEEFVDRYGIKPILCIK